MSDTTATDWATPGTRAAIYRTTDHSKSAVVIATTTIDQVTATQIVCGELRFRRTDGRLRGEARSTWNSSGPTTLLPLTDPRVVNVRARTRVRNLAKRTADTLNAATTADEALDAIAQVTADLEKVRAAIIAGKAANPSTDEENHR